ncbi:MAG: DUF1028 domain-containing protein [Lutibacter sp.]
MTKFKFTFVLILSSLTTFSQQLYKKKEPFAHTFSIVARDTITGDMGVAVQSHWFSVGSLVAWAKAGVGVVATQSFVNPSFGPRGLNLLENGLTPKMAMENLLALDPGKEVRQLAILDVNGNVASFTGKNCIAEAGNITGSNFSVQANLMEKNTVWPAMAKAFKNTSGTLAERMLAALEAAQNEGGDIRGKQSAAIIVVKAKSTGKVWNDKIVDLRVEDSKNPIAELKRLLKINTAYEFMNKGDLAVEKNNNGLAKKYYLKAQQLNPDNLEMQYWYAITLANNGNLKEAKKILQHIFKINSKWKTLTPRLIKPKLLTVSKKELDFLLNP